MRDSRALLDDLARKGLQVLGDVLRGRGRYALVDFPNHTNVGDSAIWVGELAALAGVGCGAPAYVCDLETYSAAELRRRVGHGVILIHGGGNLGDLWTRHQRFRERVVSDHPDLPIIQLPQSIHFENDDALDRARRVFDAHSDLTLLLRDTRSLERARAYFGARSALCPDLALCLPARDRNRPPVRTVQWLLRDDVESADHRSTSLPGGAAAIDWLEEDLAGPVAGARRLESVLRAAGPLGSRVQPLL